MSRNLGRVDCEYQIEIVRVKKPWPCCTRCGGPMREHYNVCYDDQKHEKEDAAAACELAKTMALNILELCRPDQDDSSYDVAADWLEQRGHLYVADRIRTNGRAQFCAYLTRGA